jgi:DNA mismatch endonuclease (patch repair protein)
MTDKVTPAQRSAIMARVRSADTTPEMTVRRALHEMGFRFRLHRRDLPGSPDIVLPRHRTAIFVHGCFWHSHEGCPRARLPASNVDYWKSKLERNRDRDSRVLSALRGLGWGAHVIWECEARQSGDLRHRLRNLIGSGAAG